MRTCLHAIVLFGFGAALLLEATPGVQAADLETTRTRVVHHKRAIHGRIVRDYDGTAVLLRPARTVRYFGAGSPVVLGMAETIPLERAEPRYYLNGQPVLPHGARSGPRIRTRVVF